MKEFKQVCCIIGLYLLTQLPAAALWSAAGIPDRFRAGLSAAAIVLFTGLVAENYRRRLALSPADIGLKFPGRSRRLEAALLVFGAAGAGLAWFALYFRLFRLALPGVYAGLLAQKGDGLLSALFSDAGSPASLSALALGLLALAAMEEFLFRGVIYNYLSRGMSWRKAMLWSSAVFALVHLKPSGIPVTFVFGVLCCLLYRRTGSLAAPAAAHFIYNFSLSLFGKYLVPGGWT